MSDAILAVRRRIDLAQLTQLTSLDLQDTSFGDQGLGKLVSLQKLKLLQLRGTNVTQDAVRAMRASMLQTRIIL